MGETIRRLREKCGYSQAEVAAYIGVSRQTYIKYEAGEIEPPIRVLRLFKKLFKVSYEQIIDGIQKECAQEPVYSEYVAESVSENAPAYGASPKVHESALDRQVNALPLDMKKVVFDLVDSLTSLAGPKDEKPVHIYRTPGGLTGKFWMADDFDETPDCFADYM